MNQKRIQVLKAVGWLVLGLGIGSGSTLAWQQWASNSTPEARAEQQPPPSAALTTELLLSGEPVLGDSTAPLTIVEFSDFECPYCRRFHEQVLPALKREYIDTGLVRFIHKDLLLPFHRQARPQQQRPDAGEQTIGIVQPSSISKPAWNRGVMIAENEPRHNSLAGLRQEATDTHHRQSF